MEGTLQMESPTIKCPECGTTIPIGEAFTKEIEARARASNEDMLRRRQQEFDERLRRQAEEFQKKAAERDAEIAKSEGKKARERVETQLRDLDSQVTEQKASLEDSRKREAELLRTKRVLEKQAEEAELLARRKLDEERKQVIAEAVATTVQTYEGRLKQMGVEADSLRRRVQDLDQQLAQGSQQSQGEAQEQALEEALAGAFPDDEFEPIKSGAQGADLLQRVRTSGGRACGSILWESKAAKNWSGSWIGKLKGDQREKKADAAVLVSRDLPDEIKTFGWHDGVWVAALPLAIPLASVLRDGLIQLARTKAGEEGKGGKKERLYEYVQSSEFLREVQAMADALVALANQVAVEKRAFQKQWKEREEQIQQTMLALAGVYGTMKGVVGAALPPVKTLELPSGE